MDVIRKKKIFPLMMTGLVFLSILFPFQVSAGTMPTFESDEGVYLMDPDTGEAYVKQNENHHYAPASTTKILTALTAMDEIADRLDERVTVGSEITMIDADSSVADLSEGDSYTWRELLYGLLLPSGNDAAMTIAVNAARLKSDNAQMDINAALSVFYDMMNAKAKSVGAENSLFASSHGLTNADHYTTPADMAKIAMKAFEDAEIAKITKMPSYTCISGNGVAQEWQNSNPLIQSSSGKMTSWTKAKLGITDNSNPFYSYYATSGKTGYTEEAGRCLVFSGIDGEMKCIGVIFKASDMLPIYTQAKQSLETAVTGYAHVSLEEPYTEVTTLFTGHFTGWRLTLSLGGHNTLTVPKDEQDQLTMTIEWDTGFFQDQGKYLTIQSDFEAGTQVATLNISGATYKNQLPLYAENGMKVMDVFDYILSILAALLLLGVLLCVIILIRKRVVRRRRLNRKRSLKH